MIGVVWWDAGWDDGCMVVSRPRDESSISSRGDSKVGTAMVDCVYRRGGASEPGSGTNAPAPIAGNVWRRGRDAALARRGRRLLCEGISGLGPQLESGEKNGDVGLLRSGEKDVLTVVSE